MAFLWMYFAVFFLRQVVLSWVVHGKNRVLMANNRIQSIDCSKGMQRLTGHISRFRPSCVDEFAVSSRQVMLLGHSDSYTREKAMQVTIAYNHFGAGLIQRMPRCRHGYFHVVNNDYTHWEMYAIGGSAEPTHQQSRKQIPCPIQSFCKGGDQESRHRCKPMEGVELEVRRRHVA